jgi:EAL domain-containing protein (putative c-di-GMP-specific phosphodiesterase class I)
VFSVGASIGVVPLTGGSATMAQLLSAADSACYVAKDRGRNQIYLSQPDDAELAARSVQMQWMEKIGRAIEDGRMRLYHQPIVSLAGDRSRSLSEILLRLMDVDGTVYEACQFISAAERFRLMPTLDRWVIDHAFSTLGRLRREGSLGCACYAVNLSGQSFGERGFLDYIAGQLDRHDVPGESVSFEITETSAITNLASAQSLIAALRQRGCRFVLDDFGSGLSSFRYLSRLKVDFLKIDGAIVRAMLDEPVLHEMVASIHRIARRMGLQTIGEWVERGEVLEALRTIGVDFAQGFLLAPPEPFGEIEP